MHTTFARNVFHPAQPMAQSREVVFIDAALPSYRMLESELPPGAEVVYLDGLQDGLAQMAHWAKERKGYGAIHVLSHGAAGRLYLGGAELGTALTQAERAQWAVIGQALEAHGDLMLYACELASGNAGRQLVQEIAQAAGVAVAASTTLTGHAALGGDWVLDHAVGDITTAPLQLSGYQHVMANVTFDAESNIVSSLFSPGGTVTQANAAASQTLEFSSSNSNGYVGALSDGAVTFFPFDGADSFIGISGDSYNFALQSGNTFDLLSLDLAQCDGSGDVTAQITTDRGGQSVSTLLPSAVVDNFGNFVVTKKNLDLSADPLFKGITWFKVEYVNGNAGSLAFAADQIVLNIGGGGPPTITSSSYDALTGTLTVVGADLGIGAIDVSKLSLTGQGGSTHALDSVGASVNGLSATGFSITLNAADQLAVAGLLNKNGTTSATGGTAFNLAAQSGWQSGAAADATNAVTVSGVSPPTITSATYDATTHVLAVTGTRLVGVPSAGNDISVSQLAVTGQGGVTYHLTSADVDVTSATSFSVTLNSADQVAVAGLFNKNGTASTGNTTYNLAASDNWNSVVTGGDISDAVSAVTVSGVPSATITSASYDAATGTLTVTGANLVNGDAVDLTKLTLTGQGGDTYALTSASVNASSTSSFTANLNAADQLAVNGLLNKNGTTSATGGTAFNVAAQAGWHNGAVADATNAVTVSNVSAPTITSATYDATTHVLAVTGTGLVGRVGAGNDIAVSQLTVTGQGGVPYSLTSADVEVTSATSFSVTLNSTDQAAVAGLFNKNGTASTGNTTYNLAAPDDWNSVVTGGDTSDAVSGIAVSGVPSATITNASYDAASGTLTVTGANLVSGDAVDVSKLSLVGQGGATYALTSANVNASSTSSFTANLNAADQLAVNGLLNKNGTSAVDSIAFNLQAAANWHNGSLVDATNAVTVSNVSVPTITSATYDATTHVLAVTGTGLVGTVGAGNDIAVSQLTVTGQGGVPYSLTSADVEVTSATSFSVTLNSTDQAAVAGLFNKNGTASTGNTTYNLAASDDWNSVVTGGDISDAVSGITVSGVPGSTITSASYDAATGTLTVTGANLISGDAVDVTKLSVTGQGGATYALTGASVNASSTTGFTVGLSAADQLAVNGLLNKNGTTSATGGTAFNVAAQAGWHNGAAADASNAVTVSNVSAPTITSATYDAVSHVLAVTGTGLVGTVGAGNDISVSQLTIMGQGGVTYGLTSADVEVTSATSFSITLNNADQTQLATLFNKNGLTSTGGSTYNLAAADDWNSVVGGVDTSDTVSAVTVSGIVAAPPPAPDTPSPVSSTTTVDGAVVQVSTTVNASTGLPQQNISVPIISSTRPDDANTPHAALADIPLAATDPNGTRMELVVSLPTGTGFQAQGSPALLSNSQALLDLIQAIQSKTPASNTAQAALIGEGTSFLAQLPGNTKLMSQTLTLTAAPGAGPLAPILVNGSSVASPAGASNSAIALVIDTTGLPSGTIVELNNVDFAAVVGATSLRGGEGNNYVVGDNAAQNMVLGAGDDVLHGGGGNDTVGSLGGNDQVFGDAGNDVVFGGTGNDTLSGGSGNDRLDGGLGWDTARQAGALADYTLRTDGQALVLTHKVSGEVDRLKSIETIQFDSGASLYIAGSDAEAALAHIITSKLGRDLTAAEGAWAQQNSGLTDLQVAQALLNASYAAPLQRYTAQELVAGWKSNPQIVRVDDASLHLQGTAGLDQVQLGGIKQADLHLQRTGSERWEATSLLDGNMAEVTSVERLHLQDVSVALDTQGTAGKLAALLLVTLGNSALANKGLVGAGLAALDAGMGVQAAGNIALGFAQSQQGHTFTAQETVQWLWTKATGSAGTEQQLQPFVQQLQSGQISSGDLVNAAVQYALAHPSAQLVGVLDSGLIYTAVA